MLRGFLNWLANGDSPRRPAKPPTRRRELLEARDSIVHQIAILEAGPASYGTPGPVGEFRAQAAELRQVLAQIDEELAALGPRYGAPATEAPPAP